MIEKNETWLSLSDIPDCRFKSLLKKYISNMNKKRADTGRWFITVK